MENRTTINLDDQTSIIQCNDCGAHASENEKIVHHKTCSPGESKYWGGVYEEDSTKEKR